MKNNKFKEGQFDIINDNVNVSKTNEIKDFFILLFYIVIFISVLFFLSDKLAAFYISKMPDSTQMKIEKLFGSAPEPSELEKKYAKQLYQLEIIKQEIIKNDDTLQGKSKFPIRVEADKDINAFIVPNGTIYFTTGTLDSKITTEELAFILAHEIGHYANRDHLKSMSREILINCILIFLSIGQNNDLTSLMQNISDFNSLQYSKDSEKKADLYAGNMLIKIYGTNKSGKDFMKRLRDNENMPEYIHYFSTHPSWNERLHLLESQH